MRIGGILPQHQAGIGAAGTHDIAPFADDLGFDHLGLYEHVIGPDLARHPDLAVATRTRIPGTSHPSCVASSPPARGTSTCSRRS